MVSWEQWLMIFLDAPGVATLVLMLIVFAKVRHVEKMLEDEREYRHNAAEINDELGE